MRLISGIVILPLLAVSTPAGAQYQGNDIHILAAVAAHFDSQLGDSTIAVDPRIAARAHRAAAGTFEGEWPQEIVETLMLRLDARSAHQVDVVQCSSGRPASCRIAGADIFMKFGRPQVGEETAMLYVDIIFASGSARTPVVARQHEVRLKLVRGRWQVFSDKVVAQT